MGFAFAGVITTMDLIGARVMDEDTQKHHLRREGIIANALGFMNRLSGLFTAEPRLEIPSIEPTADGFVIRYDYKGRPKGLDKLPASLRIEMLRESGPPEVVTDNRSRIAGARISRLSEKITPLVMMKFAEPSLTRLLPSPGTTASSGLGSSAAIRYGSIS